VRLVLTPEAVVVAEARRTFTSLAMHGYRVDGIVANRVFPPRDDEFVAGWAAAQQAQLDGIAASFGSLPLWRSPYLSTEPVGLAALAALADDIYATGNPLVVTETPEPMTVERVSADEYVLSVALPLADKREIDLVRKADELVLTVGSHRRVLALPSVLTRCVVDGAGLRDGRLRVRFRPDPDVWMRP
jgi:arsenite/tail-anchored protein-transporting ATPase